MARRVCVVLASMLCVLIAVVSPASASSGTIGGTVTSAADGSPRAGVCVFVSGSGPSAVAETASDGTWSATVLPGSYRIEFSGCTSASDLVAQYWHGTTDYAKATAVDVSDDQTVAGIDAAVVDGASIAGTVTDTAGAPIANVVVASYVDSSQPNGPSATTAADGTYILHGVPSGNWRIYAYEYQPAEHVETYYGDSYSPAGAKTVAAASGTATTGIDIHMPRPGTISGTVVDEFGQPFQGACVQASGDNDGPNTAASVAADGSYTASAAPGDYRVEFSACNGNAASVQWWPAATDKGSSALVHVVEATTTSAINGTVIRGLTISGVVRDPDGAPLSGFAVDVYDSSTGSYTGHYTRTDASGHYAVSGLRGTSYKLQARVDGSDANNVSRWYPSARTIASATAVNLSSGQSKSGVDITLPPGGTVSGTVADTSGQAIAGACVYAMSTDDAASPAARTDSGGHFTVPQLDTGSYRVGVRACDAKDYAGRFWGGTDVIGSGTTLTLTTGQAVTGVDVVLAIGGHVTGTVRDSAGQPLSGICIALESYSTGEYWDLHSATTGGDGHYDISGVNAHNDYRVEFFSCADGRYVTVYNGNSANDYTGPFLSVAPGGTTSGVDAVMKIAGSITGRVVDQFGHPVYGVCEGGRDENAHEGYGNTDGDGTFTMPRLAPGTWWIRYWDCGAGLSGDSYYSGQQSSATTALRYVIKEGQTTTALTEVVIVTTTPSPPLSPLGEPLDAAATVFWRPPADTGHAAIASYEVKQSGRLVARVAGGVHSATIHGLTNGSTYSFTVDAVNARGAGRASASVKVTPHRSELLSVSSPGRVLYGGSVTMSGRLRSRASGAALAARTLSLRTRPHGSTDPFVRLATTRTTATGSYHFTETAKRNVDYEIVFAGDAHHHRTVVTRSVAVAPRTSAVLRGNRLLVSVSPRLPGKWVDLQVRRGGHWEGLYGYALSATGTTSFRLSAAGTYRATVRAIPGLAAGYSRAVVFA